MDKTFILKNDSIVVNAERALWAALNTGEIWEMILQPFKSKRSKAQNRLYHSWINHLSNYTGHDHDDLCEYFKKRFLGAELKEVFGVEVEVPKSTTKLNVKEFTEYLERIEAVSYEMGYTLPHPDDYHTAIGSSGRATDNCDAPSLTRFDNPVLQGAVRCSTSGAEK